VSSQIAYGSATYIDYDVSGNHTSSYLRITDDGIASGVVTQWHFMNCPEGRSFIVENTDVDTISIVCTPNNIQIPQNKIAEIMCGPANIIFCFGTALITPGISDN